MTSVRANRELHGQAGGGSLKYATGAYKTWRCLFIRCYNTKNPGYRNYGGKGIRVCDRWLTFSNFFADMGARPSGMTLDRLDSSKDYCPENCRWANWRTQARSRSTTRLIEFRGETLMVSEWASRLGMNERGVALRLKLGWSLERALTEAPRANKRRKPKWSGPDPYYTPPAPPLIP